MKLNGKFLQAFWLDTIGQEDKAMAKLGVTTQEGKIEYRKTAALLCAVLAGAGTLAGVSVFGLPWGLAPLALLLVSARKLQINAKKAKTPVAPVNTLLAMPDGGVAQGAVEGKKTLWEKTKWQGQNLMIQLRTRSWFKWAVGGAVAVGLVAALAHMAVKPATVAPKALCECPLKQEPPVQGKKQTPKKEPLAKPRVVKPAPQSEKIGFSGNFR